MAQEGWKFQAKILRGLYFSEIGKCLNVLLCILVKEDYKTTSDQLFV